jgi:antitoxin ParD1/3/4
MAAMNTVTLTPDLEQFATSVVSEGRYHDVTEVVRAGLSLLRDAEQERAAFIASLDEAQAEGERDGFASADEVHRRMTAMLDEVARGQA